MPLYFASNGGLRGRAFGLTRSGGSTKKVDEWGFSTPVTELVAYAGRLNVYEDLDYIEGLEVNNRADGKTSVNLLNATAPGAYVGYDLGGDKIDFIVRERTQLRGHGKGEHYYVPIDPVTDRMIFEPGQYHRKVYVSGSPIAMTKAQIAAEAGVAESVVTATWLMENQQYGGSPAKPIANDVFSFLFGGLYGMEKTGRSDWFLFERGYTYTSSSTYRTDGCSGEDELHPLVIGAYGEGERPYHTTGFHWLKMGPRYMVVRDSAMPILHPNGGHHVIAENCRISGIDESQFRGNFFCTWRENALFDIAKEKPGSNRTYWDGSNDRVSGLFGSGSNWLLFDRCIVDRSGWAEGYDYNRSAAYPMAPSDRNHGLYITFNTFDLHIRDSLISRNASCGLQLRGGGQFERNLFWDNNIQAAIHSSSALPSVGQFTNFLDNVGMGAGFKKVNGFQGGINWGYDVSGKQSGIHGNVLAHRANPEDPAQMAERNSGATPYNTTANQTATVMDTQIYRWTATNERVEGLDPAVLDQTTLHRFAQRFLGIADADPSDLIEALKDGENAVGAAVTQCVSEVKEAFGRPIPKRTTAADVTFLPDARFEGFRWDNRLNWTGLVTAGANNADRVNLDGNFVRYGTLTKRVATLTLGGGTLDVTSGRLTVDKITDDATITVRQSGQLYCGGSTAALSVMTNNGRLNLTGAVTQLDLEATGKAQVLFGPDAKVPAGSTLSISGHRVRAGWDGTAAGKLTVEGELVFRPGVTMMVKDTFMKQRYAQAGDMLVASESGFGGRMAELRTGNQYNGAYAVLEFSEVSGLPVAGETLTIAIGANDVDDTRDLRSPITVVFDKVLTRSFAPISVFRSGAFGDGTVAPTATGEVILKSGSFVKIRDRDLLTPGTYDLTGAGVTVTNQGAVLEEGLAVTGGKLVLTIA